MQRGCELPGALKAERLLPRGQGDDDLDGALGLGGEEEDVFPDEAELDVAAAWTL